MPHCNPASKKMTIEQFSSLLGLLPSWKSRPWALIRERSLETDLLQKHLVQNTVITKSKVSQLPKTHNFFKSTTIKKILNSLSKEKENFLLAQVFANCVCAIHSHRTQGMHFIPASGNVKMNSSLVEKNTVSTKPNPPKDPVLKCNSHRMFGVGRDLQR